MSEKTSDGGSVQGEGDWKLPGAGGTREFAMREWGSNGRWGKISIEGGEWDLRSGRGWGEGMASLSRSVSGSRGGKKKKRKKVMFCGYGDVGVVGVLVGVGAVFNTGVICAGRLIKECPSGGSTCLICLPGPLIIPLLLCIKWADHSYIYE